MSFLNDLSKKVGSAASTAAKKSGELVETTKINMSISKEEDGINKIYAEIGKRVFEADKDSADSPYAELFDSIKRHQDTIRELKEKLKQIGE